MGCGTNAGLAEQVPGDSGSVREEVMQLPGRRSTGLRGVVASPPVPIGGYEIVS